MQGVCIRGGPAARRGDSVPVGLGDGSGSKHTYDNLDLGRYTRYVSEAASTWPVWALIREARHRAGLTQVELAERAGTSQPAIARYERARSMPDLATLHRLVEACGLELRLALVEPDPQREANERAALERSVEQRLDAVEQHTELVRQLRGG